MDNNKIYIWIVAMVVTITLVGCILLVTSTIEQRYDTGYEAGYSDGDLQLSKNSAMCEVEFNGKASGLLKGLLNVTHNLPANSTLELTDASGDLELSGKVKFPCGRMEKFLVEELLPRYMNQGN